MRPRIGVTTSARSGWRIFPLVAFNLWLAGGKGVRWVAGRPSDVSDVDGIVIGGGDAISPDLYGGRLISSSRLDAERDAMEQLLVAEARAQGKPVLGICRGSQMLNVALGGRLDQDAYGTYKTSERFWTILPRKTIEVVPETRLALPPAGLPDRPGGLVGGAGMEPLVLGRTCCRGSRPDAAAGHGLARLPAAAARRADGAQLPEVDRAAHA